MRQFLLLASLMGLFLYVAFAVQPHEGTAASIAGLGGLERALQVTGAPLDHVEITGWVEVQDPSAERIATEILGPAGNDEYREVRLHRNARKLYLVVRWVATRPNTTALQSRYLKTQGVLERVGEAPAITVQVEGKTLSGLPPTALVQRALDSLHALKRQPWGEGSSASGAGWSEDLPASPLEVNVQVAVRQEAFGGPSRVWIAWPALNNEY